MHLREYKLTADDPAFHTKILVSFTYNGVHACFSPCGRHFIGTLTPAELQQDYEPTGQAATFRRETD